MKGLRLILLLLLVGGCARFEPRPLSPAATAAKFEARSLTDEGLKEFLQATGRVPLTQWPLTKWDLDALTLAAFYFQPSLEVARAQWATVKAGEKTAAQRPNPSLNVTPGYNTTLATPSPWLPLGYLDVPIETSGKRRYRRAQAERLAEVARLKVAAAAWQVRTELRAALVDFTAARARGRLLDQQLTIQNNRLRLLEARLAAGAVAAPETVPARIALQRGRVELGDTRRLEAQAVAHIASAVGISQAGLRGAQFEFDLGTGLAAAGELQSSELRREALLSRADILAALAEYAAAESALRLEIARQFPDVRLQPGYQYDQGENKWTLGLNLELPILHQNQGAIAEAEARRVEIAARFTELQAKVLGQIERAAAEFQSTQATAADLRSLADAEARKRDAVLAQAKAGAADQLDIANAELEYFTAQIFQLDSQIRLQQALANLEDAVQRPLELISDVYATSTNPCAHASR